MVWNGLLVYCTFSAFSNMLALGGIQTTYRKNKNSLRIYKLSSIDVVKKHCMIWKCRNHSSAICKTVVTGITGAQIMLVGFNISDIWYSVARLPHQGIFVYFGWTSSMLAALPGFLFLSFSHLAVLWCTTSVSHQQIWKFALQKYDIFIQQKF